MRGKNKIISQFEAYKRSWQTHEAANSSNVKGRASEVVGRDEVGTRRAQGCYLVYKGKKYSKGKI